MSTVLPATDCRSATLFSESFSWETKSMPRWSKITLLLSLQLALGAAAGGLIQEGLWTVFDFLGDPAEAESISSCTTLFYHVERFHDIGVSIAHTVFRFVYIILQFDMCLPIYRRLWTIFPPPGRFGSTPVHPWPAWKGYGRNQAAPRFWPHLTWYSLHKKDTYSPILKSTCLSV